MFEFINKAIARRNAKRVTQEYPTRIDIFKLKEKGEIKFANWENPLVLNKEITDQHITFFQKFIKEGDVCIDIGANIGHMTVPMGLVVGTSGTCIAFDPNPIVFKILTQNAELNKDKANIKAFNNAISKEEADYYYHSSEASFNNGGISPDVKSRHGKFVLPNKIKGIVLQEFLNREFPDAFSKLKLIKIDTEGYDKEIAKSIVSLIHQCRPTIISECFGRMPAEHKFEYYDLLSTLGYKLHYFSDFRGDAEVVKIERREDMLKWKHFDFYAMPG
jgi:FkbM family methyltransferase